MSITGSPPRRRRSIVALLATFGAAPVLAAEYAIEPTINARTEYNDNYLFSTNNKQSLWTTSVLPGFRAVRSTETGQASLGAAVGLTHFSRGHPSNATTGSANASVDERDERNRYSADLRFNRDTTNSFAIDPTQGQQVTALMLSPDRTTYIPDIVRTGVAVQDRVQRNLLSFAPAYTRTMTERLSARIEGFYQQARFDRHGDNGLFNYDNQGATASLISVLSESTTVTTSLTTSRFKSEISRADQLAANVLAEHRYSETLTLNGGAGYFRVKTNLSEAQFCQILVLDPDGALRPQSFPTSVCTNAGQPLLTRSATSTSDNGYLLNAGLLWNATPSRQVLANARQTVTPGGTGVLLKTTSYQAGVREQLSERLTGAIDLIYTRGRGLSGPTAGLLPNSTLTTLSATLTYKITESFNVDTGIRRSEVEYGSSSAKATQNAIYAALRYDWPKLAVSR